MSTEIVFGVMSQIALLFSIYVMFKMRKVRTHRRIFKMINLLNFTFFLSIGTFVLTFFIFKLNKDLPLLAMNWLVLTISFLLTVISLISKSGIAYADDEVRKNKINFFLLSGILLFVSNTFCLSLLIF